MAITFSKAMMDYCLGDVALVTGKKPPETRDLGKVYDLFWIDPSLHEHVGVVENLAAFERTRRFPHCGAAIAWARRQIFHGKVFGEHIEMRTVHRIAVGEQVKEHEDGVVDITLPGFRRWEEKTASSWPSSSTGSSLYLEKPERKCRIAA